MSKSVSVIIPVRDRAEELIRALKSVEKQTFKDFEIIIIDDHSRTPVQETLKSYRSSLDIRVLSSQKEGVSAARNLGIQSSSSPYIALLDSDDEWFPEKLERQFSFMESHSNLPLVHTEEIWIRNGVRVNPAQKHKKSGGRIFQAATKLCLISPSASFFRRKVFEEIGFFNEEFIVCEDYELWLRLTSRFEVGFIEDPLTIKHGGHADQLSRKYHSMDLWRIRALKNFISSPFLSEPEKQAVRDEILFKSDVLLKGFEKHQNFEHQNEVLEIKSLIYL